MASESHAQELEQDATNAHFISHDDETAGEKWEEAGGERSQLGDDAAHDADYWENPVPPAKPNPDITRRKRCEAARHYIRAATDYLAAANMLEAQGKGAAAAVLKQKAKASAAKGVAWFESCLDSEFEEGNLSRTLMSEYGLLASLFELLERADDAARARRKVAAVRELRTKAAEASKAGGN